MRTWLLLLLLISSNIRLPGLDAPVQVPCTEQDSILIAVSYCEEFRDRIDESVYIRHIFLPSRSVTAHSICQVESPAVQSNAEPLYLFMSLQR